MRLVQPVVVQNLNGLFGRTRILVFQECVSLRVIILVTWIFDIHDGPTSSENFPDDRVQLVETRWLNLGYVVDDNDIFHTYANKKAGISRKIRPHTQFTHHQFRRVSSQVGRQEVLK